MTPQLSALALELLGLLVGLRPHRRFQLSPQEFAAMSNRPLEETLAALDELEITGLAHCFYLDSGDPREQTMWALEDYEQAREVVCELNGYDPDLTPPLPLIPAPGPLARPSSLAERSR